jgi:hypothetical protein
MSLYQDKCRAVLVLETSSVQGFGAKVVQLDLG